MIHGSTTPMQIRDELQTPPYLRHYIVQKYNPDIDLAATAKNRLVKEFYSAKTDAFKRPWGVNGMRVGFLNPPYSKIDPWVEKAIQERDDNGFTTIMLLPTLNGDKGRDGLIIGSASKIVYIIGRVNFVRPDTGEVIPSNPRGSMLVEFSPGIRRGTPQVACIYRDLIVKQYEEYLQSVTATAKAKTLKAKTLVNG